MEKKEIQELLDNCIGDPESMKKLINYLIEQDANTNRAFELRDKKFERLIVLLGAKGNLSVNDQNEIRSQK